MIGHIIVSICAVLVVGAIVLAVFHAGWPDEDDVNHHAKHRGPT